MPRGASTALRTLRGDSCGEQSFLPLDFKLAPGDSNHAEPMGGRSSNTTGFPFFDISYENKAYVFGIGWSGQWSRDISVSDGAVSVKIGLCDADFYLKPGEEAALPSVICMEGEDVSETRREFRAFLRKNFSPRVRLGGNMEVPLAIQPFDRYFKRVPEWATEAGQIRQIENAVRCRHFNTSWLDAAWFRNGFPDGVRR
jgi:alpha-galactosidase